MRIALDAMGGDHAPGPIVAGAIEAVKLDRDLKVVLIGDQAAVEPLLSDVSADCRERLEVFHASQVVTMEDNPIVALRKKPDSSIVRCWQQLAEKKVEALVSAGNTGAVVAAGMRLRRFLPHVDRPGIATIMPTLKGPCVMLDVGANVHPKPAHLFQYGVMGGIFAKHLLKKDAPTIGLMNIGSEEGKGDTLAKETQVIFNGSHLKDRFVGNIEGRDIHRGACDVIVCDGFLGNVILKTCEGVFDFLMKVTAKELMTTLDTEKDKGQKAIQNLVDRFDYAAHGGAPLLGVDGVCIICHGSSGALAIKNALAVASRYAALGLNRLIVEELEADPVLSQYAAANS
jgi:glycerol-3-phosphate acyltransferase PlsX